MKRSLLLFISIFIHLSLFSQYIQLINNNVNIRSGASSDNPIICQGHKGDIFEIKKRTGNWYSIKIGVGKEERFIHKSLCHEVSRLPSLPNLKTCRSIFLDFRRAEKKALDMADKKVPVSSSNYVKKLIAVENKYFTKFTMDVFQKYNIPPALYNSILELGFKKGWNTATLN